MSMGTQRPARPSRTDRQEIARDEFLGVYRTPAMGRTLLGSVAATLDARRYGMPSDLIVSP
ncbi:hypothetical protein [Streptomyces sp. NPDC004682]